MERLMTETTKAPSKEAMEAVRGVRCPHEPVNCDYCVAAALEAFVAPVAKNLIELASAHITVTLDRDALRERNRALVAAISNVIEAEDDFIKRGTYHRFDTSLQALRAALAADAKT